MALHPARQEELKQLTIFKGLVNSNPKSGFKLDVKRAPGNLDYSELIVTFSGVKMLVVNGLGHRDATSVSAKFVIPPGHPHRSRVATSFLTPVPFHPHVSPSGIICWGTVATNDSGSWTLVLWTIALLEYLQMNQHTFIGINESSPMNSTANSWYRDNKSKLSRILPQLDFKLIRALGEQSIG